MNPTDESGGAPPGSALLLASHPPGSGSGSAVRNGVVLKALQSEFGTVDVVAFALADEVSFALPETLLIPRPPKAGRARVAASLRHGGIFFAPDREAGLTKRLRDLVASGRLRPEYDLIWLHQSLMANAGLKAIPARAHVLDVDNVAGPVMRAGAAQMANGDLRNAVRRAHLRLHAAAAEREERRQWARFKHLVVASEAERTRLGRLAERATVIENAVPPPESPADRHSSDLLFVGRLNSDANVLAAQQLVQVVFPRIRAACPKATLTVAGTAPRADVARICRVEGVTLVSNAPSLTPLYGGTRVFAAMLPFGGGTKIKVIEAMAHGIPLVVNSVTAEGLALEDGANALIRDTPDSFAAGCVELLRDGSLARRMGAAARATWFSNYRPESVEASIKALLETVRRPD